MGNFPGIEIKPMTGVGQERKFTNDRYSAAKLPVNFSEFELPTPTVVQLFIKSPHRAQCRQYPAACYSTLAALTSF